MTALRIASQGLLPASPLALATHGLLAVVQTEPNPEPKPFPAVYSSMGRKRREARLQRIRADDEMVLKLVAQFLESL